MKAPEAIDTLGAVSGSYDAVFCDVWGVVHDGVRKHAEAERALLAARRAGAKVVLLTNSPRPSEGVTRQLDGFDVSRDAYDAIVTSGDVTRALISAGGRRIFHIGPERNNDVFAGLDVVFVGEDQADAAVATGLFDDANETPADYADLLARLAGRGLPMICANPDIVVHRGDDLIFCAGMVAREYEALGGAVLMAGKPFRPIYELAERMAGIADPARVLAVGDGLNTDIRGANGYGCDVLLILEGIHRDELGGIGVSGPVLAGHLEEKGLSARFFMPMLA